MIAADGHGDDSSASSSDDDEPRTLSVPHAHLPPPKFAHISEFEPFDALSSGAPINSVHTVQKLVDKRRTEGFCREDGVPTPYGGASQPDDTLYSPEWLRCRIDAQETLDADPYYRFGKRVAGSNVLPLEDIIDDSAAQRATQQRISQAIARVRTQANERTKQLSTPAQIAQMRATRAELVERFTAATRVVSQLQSARKCVIDSSNRIDTAVATAEAALSARGNTDAELFAAVCVWTVEQFGDNGYRKTLAVSQQVIASLAAPLVTGRKAGNKKRVADNMPITSNLSLSLAMLLVLSNDAALLAKLANATSDELSLLDATSEYATDVPSYAHDLITLANLLFTEKQTAFQSSTDNLLVYGKITHALYAHLNKMHRRSALDEDDYPPLRRPRRPTQQPPDRDFGNIDVDLDVDIADLEGAAEGVSVGSLTPDQLRAAQNELGENQSSTTTPLLVEQLLRPMLDVVYPLLFFASPERSPDSDPRSTESFIGTPDESSRIRQTTATISRRSEGAFVTVLHTALAIFNNSIGKSTVTTLPYSLPQGADPLALHTKFKEILKANNTMSPEFRYRTQNTLLHTSGFALCVAQAVVAAASVGFRVLDVTDAEVDALRAYTDEHRLSARATEPTETKVMRIIARGHPSTIAATASMSRSTINFKLAIITPSIKKKTVFDQAIDGAADRVQFAQFDLAKTDSALRAATKELDDSLAGKTDDFESKLVQALNESYIPSAREALAPRNTGVMFFSGLMVASVEEAQDMLREYIPCFYRMFPKSEQLIESDEYASVFGGLVSAVLRRNTARNAVTYKPDRSEFRGTEQIASALNSIRSLFYSNTKGQNHGYGCTCNGVAGGIYPALAHVRTPRTSAMRRFAGIGGTF